MNEAWAEVVRQDQIVARMGQVTCGLTTHLFGDCYWCGARV